MSWPLSQDYNEAIQDPAANFSDPELKTGQAVTNALGLPLPRSGNFADVYEFHCPATGNKWAIKCFTRAVAGQAQRYADISRHLQQARLPFGVDFQYLAKGIRIGGQWYPILKMRWVEGLLLNEFARDQVHKPVLLHALSQIWLRMSRRLREVRIAHADLQHGNVILVPGRKMQSLAVKLIDYDGMFVPTLAGKKSGEIGHPNYQHPQRLREGTYSGEVDRFPLLVVATALRALELGGRSLWERYDNGDNLLFKETDLRDPASSALFRELRQASDALLKKLASRLEQACHLKLERAPLVEELVPEEKAAAGRGQAGGIEGAEANVWDFGDPEVIRKVAPQRRQRSSAWAWIAASVAAVAVAGGVVFLATRGGSDNQRPGPAVALSPGSAEPSEPPPTINPPVTPQTRLAATPSTGPVEVPQPSPKAAPNPDPPKDPAEAVPASPVTVTYEKPAMWPPRLLRALSPTDSRLAMTEGANNWCLVDANTMTPYQKFVGHKGPVTCLSMTADGQRALTGSEDRTLRLWDLNTGQTLRVLGNHNQAVVDVALSADGSSALSTDGSVTALLWDVDRAAVKTRVRARRPVTAAALSPDGSRGALGLAPQEGQLGSAVFLIDMIDTESGQKPLFTGHTETVTSLAFSLDGERLVFGGKDRVVCVENLVKVPGLRIRDNLPSPVVRVGFLPTGKQVLVEMESNAWVLSTATQTVLARTSRPKDAPKCYYVDEEENTVWSYSAPKDKSLVRWREGTINPERVALKPPTPPTNPSPPPKPAPKVERRSIPDPETVNRIKERWEDLDRRVKQGVVFFRNQPSAVDQALGLMDEAKAEEEYDLALKIGETARRAANRSRSSALKGQVARAEQDVAITRGEFKQLKKHLDKLATDPENPEANLAVGRFRCCLEDNWEEGLPLLAKGNDKGLQTAAVKDMQDADTPAGCKQIGDLWYEQGKRTFSIPIQPALRRRAVLWYRLIPSNPTYKMPADTKVRLDSLVPTMPELAPWGSLDTSEATFRSDCFHLEPYKAIRTKRIYRGGIDVTVVARTEKDNIRLAAGDGGLAVFNWESAGGGLMLQRPDAGGNAGGRGSQGGSVIAPSKPDVVLKPNQWYVLRWKMTPLGMKVWVDGKVVFEKEEVYDLSFSSPVAVCSYDCPIDVRSVIVKGVCSPAVPKEGP